MASRVAKVSQWTGGRNKHFNCQVYPIGVACACDTGVRNSRGPGQQGGVQPLGWLVVEMDCPLAVPAAEASFLFGLNGSHFRTGQAMCSVEH